MMPILPVRAIAKTCVRVFVIPLAVFASGCSGEALKRFAYDVGQQYACLSGHENATYEAVADPACMAGGPSVPHEDFAAARKREIGDG